MTRLDIANAWADTYKPPSERAIEMGRLYIEEGLTLQEIGDRYGITRERVRQIILPFGFEPHGGRRKRTERLRALNEAYARIMADESTIDEEAEQLGYASGDSLRSALGHEKLWLAGRRPPPEHGTVRRYRAGCHCDECRRAHREDIYAYRQRRGEPPQHGTASAYINFACRCQPCTEAMRLYRREMKARKRQEKVTTD